MDAVRAVLDGTGPAVHLGGEDDVAVPAGTAAVVTTSGSTGYPKNVALSRDALLASARATALRIGEGAWLLALPPTYVAGLQVIVRSVRAGHLPAVVEGHFTAEAFVAATTALSERAAGQRLLTSLVPTQLTRLIDAGDDPGVRRALAAYDAILVGGQALPDAVSSRAAEHGARLIRTYGASETSGGCVYDGRPLDGVRVAIVDGEIRLAGPTLADGYLDDAERTAAAFVLDDGERWYRTGDAGVFADGLLQVTGRIDNVIISGGINVSLDRVERAVRALPGLSGAVVIGVDDDRWGEASVVVVPRGDGPHGDAAADRLAEVRAAVGREVGAPARPQRIEVVDALPVLSSGKPDRVALRRRLS